MENKIKIFANVLILSLGILVLFLVLILKSESLLFNRNLSKNNLTTPAEIVSIKATTNLSERVELYKKLIERVGPEQAQLDLYLSGLPFNGETHLLNHTVGDYLYEKYGNKGLLQCRDYFLSSCYHGFILHAIAEGGMMGVSKTFDECRKAGPAVSSQCAHAIGHGFLANLGYRNLTKALETCDEAVKTMDNFPAFNCYDGVFMENIWAVHDGEPSPDRWVKESDPIYPCNDPRIDSKYINACWSNQPSLTYQLFKGDLKKVGEVCLDVKNKENQQMCFDGLSRQIHPLTNGSTSKTFELCGLLPESKWSNYCVVTNAVASFSVGDRVTPFEICASVGEEAKKDCYDRLFGIMYAYVKAPQDLKMLCLQVRDKEWRKKCNSTF